MNRQTTNKWTDEQMMNAIKHIIFDLGQVFIKVDVNAFAKNFVAEFGIDPAELSNDGYDGIHKEFMLGKITGEEFHRMTCEHFNHIVPFDKFKTIWESMLVGEVAGTAEIVDRLLRQNYSLALLSNTDPWHYEYSLKNIPILHRIDKNFLSYELKMEKPNAEIFSAAARDLHAEPGQCLFIDDLHPNIEGARTANLKAIQFTDAKQLRHDLTKFGINV
jgi:FMN phosphatase YigB (HAD superfamily)